MATFHNTAFLCAYFSVNEEIEHDSVLYGEGWREKRETQENVSLYRRFFYPGFVDFMLGPGLDNSTNTYHAQTHVRRFFKKGPGLIKVVGKDVEVKEIILYLMPYGMALYAIHTEMESDDLDDFTLTLYNMRELRNWRREEMADFQGKVIDPLEKLASGLSGMQALPIVENGNKLKVFQIVTAEKRDDFRGEMNDLLFELGTLGKIGGYSSHASDSPSISYVETTLKDHRLSFYNNWVGLALFDTFTILGYDVRPWVRDTWSDDYFGLIYIHSLFCKFYLFSLAARFQSNPEESEILEKEYHEFERLYTFHRISYNFLPGEIDRAIDRSLEISDEKELIAKYISDYNKLREEESADKLNRILTFLAIVTVFSTIWDFACMLNAMWPFNEFSNSLEIGFRVVISLTLLAVIISIIYMLKKPKSFK